ncbi:hypothetical protein [Parasitella parasitica]|uniref:Uncharacterized protein n=1 Tax=Parasitella parasitica TaxID=35722 RepID=A0A0B7NEJ6_9FUNG|nr:hypothetical protein [Parasitella parasitica]
MGSNITNTEEGARQSSKLSLGSSPSALSADDQLEGDGPLTPIDKMHDDVEDDDDDLSALNSILQAGSPGSLSDEEEEEEEDARDSEGDDEDEDEEDEDEEDSQTEQDSASPLSSVPDDFPLSRSASPELPPVDRLRQEEEEADGEDEDEDDTVTTNTTTTNVSAKDDEDNDDDEEDEVVVERIPNRKLSISGNLRTSKKRRKEVTKKKSEIKEESESENGPSLSKRAKQFEPSITRESSKNTDTSSSSEDTTIIHNTKKRRVSRSTLESNELPRTRRRQSRQDESLAKTEEEQTLEEVSVTRNNDAIATGTMDVDNKFEEKNGTHAKATNDETEKDCNKFDKQKDQNEDHTAIERSEDVEVENDEELEEQRGNHEAQDNDDHDYQHRHQEALDALTHIEIEFARLRDKMYQEKMAELHDEARMIADGTHPELVTLLAEIEEKKGKRINSAEAWRKYQYDNFKQQFEGLEYQANIHFISQKNALRRELLGKINNKRWSIEDERTKLNDPARGEREFPDGRELVVHKREQKEETGELQDIKEAIGFPMAPNPSGLNIQDVDDDLKLLGIKQS